MKASSVLALPKPRVVADAICGAPAQALAAAEEQKLAEQENADDNHLDSASNWEVCQHQPDLTHEAACTAVDNMPCILLPCNRPPQCAQMLETHFCLHNLATVMEHLAPSAASLTDTVRCLQWEDAADGEEDWESAEAPISTSGVAGSFDVEASAEAGIHLALTVLQSDF